MHKTRLSLFYLVGYLIPSGLFLLLVPQFALNLLFSNRAAEYGDIFPRLTGILALALGLVIVQIIRLRIEALYTTTLLVRAVLLVCIAGLYLYARDPFFLVLMAIIGFGVLFTLGSYLSDRRSQSMEAKHA